MNLIHDMMCLKKWRDKYMVTIDKLRFDKGRMTQEQLAKELGTDQATISKWESNPLSINSRNLIKLALYFDVTVDELLGIENKRKTYGGNFF